MELQIQATTATMYSEGYGLSEFSSFLFVVWTLVERVHIRVYFEQSQILN